MPDLDPDPAPPTGQGPSARHEATAFFIVALIWLPLMAIAVGALVLPPGVAFSLIRRGLAEDHLSWIVLGAAGGSVWLAALVFAGRRLVLRGATDPARSR